MTNNCIAARHLPAGGVGPLDRPLIKQAVYYSPDLELAYLENPKVACTSIKASLWSAARRLNGIAEVPENPHDRAISPFVHNVLRLEQRDRRKLAEAQFFSVVRNPYTRALSAYLNKISGGPNSYSNLAFCRRFYLKHPASISFRDFLKIIASEKNVHLNKHFRQQYVNILYAHTNFDFLGYMENMLNVGAWLAARGVILSDESARHQTGAGARLAQYYGEEEIALVEQIYDLDFHLFGYSRDLEQAGQPATLPESRARHEATGTLRRCLVELRLISESKDADATLADAFSAATSPAAKLEIAERALSSGDGSYLPAYISFCAQRNKLSLARKLMDRLVLLQTAHLADLDCSAALNDEGRSLSALRRQLVVDHDSAP